MGCTVKGRAGKTKAAVLRAPSCRIAARGAGPPGPAPAEEALLCQGIRAHGSGPGGGRGRLPHLWGAQTSLLPAEGCRCGLKQGDI